MRADIAPEAALLAGLVRECAAAGIPRCVLLVLLSGLPRALRRPQLPRLARDAIEPLAQSDRARVFRLSGDDLAVVWRGDAAEALDATTAALKRLVEDDEAADVPPLWALFRLPGDADALLDRIAPPARAVPPPPVGALAGELDVAALAALEGALATVDVSRFVRRQGVQAAGTDGLFRLRWERRFLSIAELSETLSPDRAVRGDPWLFRRLTRTLDQRMLALLSAPLELREARPFSLGLNVASILSPGFLRFDAALPAALRGQVILELRPPDVLGDTAAFVFARDFARARGYRLLLCGLEAAFLPVFPLERMGLDLMALRWSETMRDVAQIGPDAARCVLRDVDTREALTWARARGVGFLQGRAVDPG
jgi:hypothetical protein